MHFFIFFKLPEISCTHVAVNAVCCSSSSSIQNNSTVYCVELSEASWSFRIRLFVYWSSCSSVGCNVYQPIFSRWDGWTPCSSQGMIHFFYSANPKHWGPTQMGCVILSNYEQMYENAKRFVTVNMYTQRSSKIVQFESRKMCLKNDKTLQMG